MYKYSKAYSGNEHIEFIEQDIFSTNVPLDAIYNDTENNGDINYRKLFPRILNRYYQLLKKLRII